MSEKIVNYEDEIDLRELIKTLWIYKYLILIFTSFITILSIIYVLQKNPTPIYKGSLYMEIGTIQDKNFQPVIIENAKDLAYILNLEFDVKAVVPKERFVINDPLPTKLIEISFENEDKNKILMHKDLAEKNNLKVGDKIKIKSNLFDADNEKGANETVEVEIKGLFDGHNSGGVSAAQELYENTLITDVHTAAKVYGNTEDTAVYQDATFFVKGDKNLDSVIKEIEKLDINWREYNLIKSSSNYPALQQSISGIYSISNKLFVGSLIFAGVVVSLLLFLWMNARKKEIAVLLSLGISKLEIFGQFLIEMVFISIPAYVGSYFLARYTAEKLGNNILNKVTGDIAKQIARQSASSQLGGGAEAEGFNKTLSSLDINVLPKFIIYVVIFMSLVLLVSLIISSFNILRRNPKELLIDNN